MSEKENRKTYDTWDYKIPIEGLKFSERNVVWKVYSINFLCMIAASMVSDITNTKRDITEKGIRVVYVFGKGNTEEKSEAIKNICDHYKDDNYIICTAAYVDKDEFPEDMYYDPYTEPPVKGKEPVPYKEVLERESKMLEGLGFVNINNFVQYETKVAYIYPNALGKKI